MLDRQSIIKGATYRIISNMRKDNLERCKMTPGGEEGDLFVYNQTNPYFGETMKNLLGGETIKPGTEIVVLAKPCSQKIYGGSTVLYFYIKGKPNQIFTCFWPDGGHHIEHVNDTPDPDFKTMKGHLSKHKPPTREDLDKFGTSLDWLKSVIRID